MNPAYADLPLRIRPWIDKGIKNMRLFIAVLFSDDIKNELEDIQNKCREHGVKGAYIAKSNLHLTLVFIGEYGDPERVKQAIASVKFRPFPIHPEKMGAFRDLWWAGLSKSKELKNVAERLRQALENAGIPFDTKPFSPHITLIRRAKSPDNSIPGELRYYTGKNEMTVSRISLMRSDRKASELVYTEIT